ncbi:hypothetical protein CGRA01v4_10882 [Colletotrichum graminicola]|uniref:Uncharacterized protein n=1 Tax=Colletotrichum graminicola (strain M1.001 / M2 / FGSC 10212) TaxID=645133 RepID=E3QXH7_COLGM|nr:uncharacterized protein GLRG_10709 [Colletotrichum graminicola M1.001]EFQ35565.1 hypothetical protein GLRG_10709 [Colletotrichum graminicola M1.001]WDK19595.1 hypothetical protein CGRA01v4_10882 [Colletotrichum graminicola]
MPDQDFRSESQTCLIRHDTAERTHTVVAQKGRKESLYQRLQSKKRGEISEEDLLKYTGMSKNGLAEWAKDRPGVGRNKRGEAPPEAASIVTSGC